MTPSALAAALSAAFVDRLLPAHCVLCHASGAPLCDACRRDATAGASACCARCALPLPARDVALPCGRCLRRPPAFDRTCAAAAYAPPFDQIVQGLKYGAMLAYAPLLADLVARHVETSIGNACDAIDLVVPVPSSRARMQSRGFNQAIEIGRWLATAWDRPLDSVSVLRIHDTLPQAGLALDERRRNVRGAFAVTDAGVARVAGLRVAVVDDVMTTGATLDELARTLKRAGAARIVNVVVARRR